MCCNVHNNPIDDSQSPLSSILDKHTSITLNEYTISKSENKHSKNMFNHLNEPLKHDMEQKKPDRRVNTFGFNFWKA
jgi:hypothetical protein